MAVREGFVAAARASRTRVGPDELRLGLLGGFELTAGGKAVSLPMSAQRLLAFVAVQEKPVNRLYIAGNLWLDTSEKRALGNLRSTLWRLRRAGCDPIDASAQRLDLAPAVRVDFHRTLAAARQVLHGPRTEHAARLIDILGAGDVLPDWYDEWVVFVRERLRQLRLHALETLCAQLASVGDFTEAIEAGVVAAAADPLRESAHRAVIRAHLAEGNQAEAVRQYHLCRDLLQTHLDATPSGRMEELVHDFLAS